MTAITRLRGQLVSRNEQPAARHLSAIARSAFVFQSFALLPAGDGAAERRAAAQIRACAATGDGFRALARSAAQRRAGGPGEPPSRRALGRAAPARGGRARVSLPTPACCSPTSRPGISIPPSGARSWVSSTRLHETVIPYCSLRTTGRTRPRAASPDRDARRAHRDGRAQSAGQGMNRTSSAAVARDRVACGLCSLGCNRCRWPNTSSRRRSVARLRSSSRRRA
jgi:hypothetical protein